MKIPVKSDFFVKHAWC